MMCLVVLSVVAYLTVAVSLPSPSPSPAEKTSELARKFKSLGQFSGVWKVFQNGQKTFSTSMGMANEENSVPMTEDRVFPIGSNTKLFTAIALYQLQEAGKFNISTPVNDLLDEEDLKAFGVENSTRWCPRLEETPEGLCENVTTEQLLSMSSGIVDAFNCDVIGFDSPYCHPLGGPEFVIYKGSMAAYISLFIHSPLMFKPGTGYSYSNPNFVLAGYLIEKFSGQSYSEYLRDHIASPLGLNSTAFDPWAGEFAFVPGYVDQYVKFFSQSTAQDFPSLSGKEGEERASHGGTLLASGSGRTPETKLLSVGSCRPYWSPGGMGATGGMTSSVDDLASVYQDLFSSRGESSRLLSESSVRLLLRPLTRPTGAPEGIFFAQGVIVRYSNGTSASTEGGWPEAVEYCGGTMCSHTCIGMRGETVAAAFSNNAHAAFKNETVRAEWWGRADPATLESKGLLVRTDGHASKLRFRLLDMWTS